jgi:hypothetical protein
MTRLGSTSPVAVRQMRPVRHCQLDRRLPTLEYGA